MRLETGLGRTKICFEALRNGEIDVYPEYTGTGLFAILDASPTERGAPPAVTCDDASEFDGKREFDRRFELEWLAPPRLHQHVRRDPAGTSPSSNSRSSRDRRAYPRWLSSK